MTGHS